MVDDLGRVLLALSLHDERTLDDIAGTRQSTTSVSHLDARSMLLVQVSALICIDAETPTVQLFVERALAAGVEPADLLDVLGTLLPLIGTPRVAAGAASLARGLGYDLDRTLERHDSD